MAVANKILQKLREHYRRVMPFVLLRWNSAGNAAGNGAEISACRLSSLSEWQACSLSELPPSASPFAKFVWLIDEDRTFFRRRTFPADLISKADLTEAIKLDLDSWAPWGRNSGYYAWPVRQGDEWSVAVWVWNGEVEDRALANVASQGIDVTHLLPKQAWDMFCVFGQEKPLLLLASAGEKGTYSCLAIDSAGLGLSAARVSNSSEAGNLMRSLGSTAEDIAAMVLIDTTNGTNALSWFDERLEQLPLPATRPGMLALASARRDAAKNWQDPLVWRTPLLLITGFLLVWMLLSGLFLVQREAFIEEQLSAVEETTQELLRVRDRIVDLDVSINAIYAKRRQQAATLKALAELSDHLPKDAWIDYVVDDGEAIEIKGQGKSTARLAAELEKMPSTAHVAYLKDIRPDTNTGLEAFQLRLTHTQNQTQPATQPADRGNADDG